MAEAVGVVLSVAQTLLAALDNEQLKKLCSMFGYESQLLKLQETVTTIKAVLVDVASGHHELNEEGKDLVKKLKDAVYDADDLLDEYATVALQLKSLPGGRLSKKVRQFFSDKNQLRLALNMSREIKKLREKLDDIAKNKADFGLNLVHKPVKERPETCSYVYESGVIGREEDKKTIMDMLLLDSDDVSFVTIVGMGGLGKTTLAQIVYNDDQIKKAFPLMRLWVCVSEDFGMKQILSKMFQSATKGNPGDLVLDVLQGRVKEDLQGGKYLLVLDDVWEESPYKWDELKEFLVSGARGSRILVTTRSRKVGMAVQEDGMYELKGLSEEHSWDLFKKVAFQQANSELEEVGRDIVKKCANVPLSIKVTASLLRGQDKMQWLKFRKMNLAEMGPGNEDVIMATLMFSYHHLTPELKTCFSFCSLFPKDYIIRKERLISLWLAQGFLAPVKGESIEDVGDSYFSILMHRCFFQDIELNEHGDVKACKMHDLIHDLAQKVAGEELLMTDECVDDIDGEIRHLCIVNDPIFANCCSSTSMNKLRTCLWFCNWKGAQEDPSTIISYFGRLRVLDLSYFPNTLPNTLGKLLHLRYLDLSYNQTLDKLPKSITQLHNLQILLLKWCSNLKELPHDTSKLMNLRSLDINGCDKLTHMPAGMHKLTCLHKLTRFVVGGDDCKYVKKGELADLKDLVNLRGELCIKVKKFSSDKMPNVPKGSSSSRNAQLKALEIFIELQWDQGDELICGAHETLLEGLPKNDNLRKLEMNGYQGTIFPSWASPMSTSLPQLVSIELVDCGGLKHLSSLGQLGNLKILKMYDLLNVECMDDDLPSPLMPFFPSLEELEMEYMEKLKGWWRELRWIEREAGVGCLVDGNGIDQLGILPFFPRLRKLEISMCENMTYFPPCPHVKKLSLIGVNKEVTLCMKGISSNLQVRESDNCTLYLNKLEIADAGLLNTLLHKFVRGAKSIVILGYSEDTRRYSEAFQRCASSIRSLEIRQWNSMEGAGLEHLANLQSLEISLCSELDLEEEDDKGRSPWKSLRSLSSLTLANLPKLVKLPLGLLHLTSLQSLRIDNCSNLEGLGECMGFLTSLQSLHIEYSKKFTALPKCITSLSSLKSLHIWGCPNLQSLPEAMRQLSSLTTLYIHKASIELIERCRRPDGLDWPNICHIPNLHIT